MCVGSKLFLAFKREEERWLLQPCKKVSERHNQAKLKAESKCDGVKADSSGSVNHFPSLYQVGNKENNTKHTHTNTQVVEGVLLYVGAVPVNGMPVG